MTKREQAKFEKRMAAWGAEIRAEHAGLRARILAARPGWDAAALAGIERSHGHGGDAPGLRDILDAVQKHDALAARFGGAL